MHPVSEMEIQILSTGCTLSTDFLAGSFVIDDEARPRVITLDFPPLPEWPGEESRLLEHGMTQE